LRFSSKGTEDTKREPFENVYIAIIASESKKSRIGRLEVLASWRRKWLSLKEWSKSKNRLAN